MSYEEGIEKELNQYRSIEAYPDRIVVAPNHYYAQLLLEVYAGMTSEFTSYAQYSYHCNYNLSYNKAIAKALGALAKVENIHMGLLFQLITELGHYPVYSSSENSNEGYWSGEFVFYGREVKEQIQSDLDMEYRGIKQYNTVIQLIKDSYIQKVLKRIVKDEEIHIKVLTGLLEQLE